MYKYPVNCFIQLLYQSSVIANHINSSHPPILPTGEDVKAEVSKKKWFLMGEGSQKYFGTYQQIKKTPILSAGDEIKAELSNKNCGFRLGRYPKNILILINK